MVKSLDFWNKDLVAMFPTSAWDCDKGEKDVEKKETTMEWAQGLAGHLYT